MAYHNNQDGEDRKKMNREKKMKVPLAILEVVLIFVLAFAFALALPSTSAAAAEAEVVKATISIGNASASFGNTTIVPVMIYDAKNVGVVDLNLSYNPSVVKVIDVAEGDFDTTIPNLEHTDTGLVRIGALQTENPGLNATVVIANITLKAVGIAGQFSPLNLCVNEFKDATPESNDIPYLVSNGTFTIIYLPTFDTGSGTYPSIMGVHYGTIKPSHDVIVNKMYTYACEGTGGHTEYVELYNKTFHINATWNGYQSDYRNITFPYQFTLLANHRYNYTIRTGSYPQIIHVKEHEAEGVNITCSEFIDANGKKYDDWIPAIKLQ